MNPIEPYAIGIVSASVCAHKDVTLDQVTAFLNREHATGVSPWTFAEHEAFSTGEPNPCKCNLDEQRLHRLFHC
jgi:hypothetical protein